MRLHTENELKIFVKSVLAESVVLEEGEDWIYGGGGFGFTVVGKEWLQGFTRPFTDAAKVIFASVQDVAVHTKGFLKTVAASVATLILPFFQADFKKIQDETAKQSKEVFARYKDVFDRVDKSLTSDDFGLVFFAINPGLYFATKLAKLGGKLTMDFVNAVDKGSKPLIDKYGANVNNALDKFLKTNTPEEYSKLYGLDKKKRRKYYRFSVSPGEGNDISKADLAKQLFNSNKNFGFKVLYEADEGSQDAIEFINNSILGKKLRNAAISVLNIRLVGYQKLIQRLKQLAAVKSIEQLQSFVGRQFSSAILTDLKRKQGKLDASVIRLAVIEYTKLVTRQLDREITSVSKLRGVKDIVDRLQKMKQESNKLAEA